MTEKVPGATETETDSDPCGCGAGGCHPITLSTTDGEDLEFCCSPEQNVLVAAAGVPSAVRKWFSGEVDGAMPSSPFGSSHSVARPNVIEPSSSGQARSTQNC